jgi:RNA recognition motif-containing protein
MTPYSFAHNTQTLSTPQPQKSNHQNSFLGWWVTEKELEALFAPHGALASVRLLISKKSRRSREQAFVEFAELPAAAAAIAALDGLDAPALVKQPGCGGLVVRFADRRKDEE